LGVTEPPTVPPGVGGPSSRVVLLTHSRSLARSAHRCRSQPVHRPAFLAVPEIDDEDRLGAGVVHPDDSHGGAHPVCDETMDAIAVEAVRRHPAAARREGRDTRVPLANLTAYSFGDVPPGDLDQPAALVTAAE